MACPARHACPGLPEQASLARLAWPARLGPLFWPAPAWSGWPGQLGLVGCCGQPQPGQAGLLQPGASELVPLSLSAHDLAIWDEAGAGWVPAAGEFVAHVGASSRDLRLEASFEVVL